MRVIRAARCCYQLLLGDRRTSNTYTCTRYLASVIFRMAFDNIGALQTQLPHSREQRRRTTPFVKHCEKGEVRCRVGHISVYRAFTDWKAAEQVRRLERETALRKLVVSKRTPIVS